MATDVARHAPARGSDRLWRFHEAATMAGSARLYAFAFVGGAIVAASALGLAFPGFWSVGPLAAVSLPFLGAWFAVFGILSLAIAVAHRRHWPAQFVLLWSQEERRVAAMERRAKESPAERDLDARISTLIAREDTAGLRAELPKVRDRLRRAQLLGLCEILDGQAFDPAPVQTEIAKLPEGRRRLVAEVTLDEDRAFAAYVSGGDYLGLLRDLRQGPLAGERLVGPARTRLLFVRFSGALIGFSVAAVMLAIWLVAGART